MRAIQNFSLATVLVSWICTGGAAPPVAAHTEFKKELSRQYPGLTIKCELCHVKGKEKTEVNDFGRLFTDELAGQELTKQWDALKGAERKKFEKETLLPAFQKAHARIKALENDEGKTWHDLLDAGAMENTKLKKGVAKGTDKPAGDDEEEEDEEDEEDGDSGEMEEQQGIKESDGGDGKKEQGGDSKKEQGGDGGGGADGGKKESGSGGSGGGS